MEVFMKIQKNFRKESIGDTAKKTLPAFAFVGLGTRRINVGARAGAPSPDCTGGCGGQCLSGCKDECITVSN
jgi:hypothetical protein